MTIQYGLTLDNQNMIIDKAKSKKDGVYRFRGVAYRVINNHAVYFAADGKIIQACYGFNAVIGSYEYNLNQINAIKALKNINHQ